MVKIVKQRETDTDHIITLENENGKRAEIMVPKEEDHDVYPVWDQPYVCGLNLVTNGHYS